MFSPNCIGPGLDPDVWRILLSARHIAKQHTYVASRLPGHPVPEYVYALASNSPIWILICITILISICGLVSYYRILRKIERQDALFPFLAFACTPVVIINCMTAMDYMWAMSFIFLSFLYALRKRSMLSALFLGIAIGCRITSLLMAAPVFYLIFTMPPKHELKESVGFFGVIAIVAAFCYLPVVSTYGFSFFTHANAPFPTVDALIKLLIIDTFGILGSISIVTALLYHHFKKDHSPARKDTLGGQWKNISWMVVCLYGLLFLYLPVEAGYLIPLLPFCYLLLQHYIARTAFKILTCGLVLSPFLVGLDAKDRPWSVAESPLSLRTSIAGRDVSLDPLEGPMSLDLLKRRAEISYADSILKWSERSSEGKVVLVTGVWLPMLTYLANCERLGEGEEGILVGRTKLVGLLDSSAAVNAGGSASAIYFIPGQDLYNCEIYGVELRKLGARPLEMH